jgi:MFS family permease
LINNALGGEDFVLPGMGPITPWRVMFVIGTIPALLAVVIRRRLKEPERWQAAAAEGEVARKLGSYRELFGDPRWRHRAIVGMLLGSAGIVGLWAVGFFSPDLTRSVFRKNFEEQARSQGSDKVDWAYLATATQSPQLLEGLEPAVQPADLIATAGGPSDAQLLYSTVLMLKASGQPISLDTVVASTEVDPKRTPAEAPSRWRELLSGPALSQAELASHAQQIVDRSNAIKGGITRWAGYTSLAINIGAFFGIYSFAVVTQFLGRRPTFAIAFILAAVSTAFVFWNLQDFSDVWWMVGIMGFCQLSLFGGYAVYFPELFPTHLRSTGTSFCYNVGRYVAALGHGS